MRAFRKLGWVVCGVALAACDGGASSDEGAGGAGGGGGNAACSDPVCVVTSTKERNLEPGAPDADVQALAQGNTQFALDLYGRLRTDDGNLFYSPYSISLALAMTWAGARGETAQQMSDTLHFPLGQDALHPAFDALDLALASRADAQPAPEQGGDPFRLSIANSIWGAPDHAFLPPFLDVLAQSYGAGLRLTDFAADAEAARKRINQWVSDETAARIPELLPQGSVDAATALVLVNAIYFKASWAQAFDENATHDGDFHLADGSTVQVPLMHTSQELAYGAGDGFQVVRLPYVGGQVSMLVVAPDAGTLSAFEAGLDADRLNAILGSLHGAEVNLALPKFTFGAGFDLVDALTALGMPAAFADGADFSGMDGTRDLVIGGVFHQAWVGVDEHGTEAAAATAVVVGTTSAPVDPPVDFTVDRPFLFLIRDDVTGSILFVGRVADPRAG
jgi:serpin B